jgi:uncharacterized protein YndB with AHSA1/START domain
MATRARTVPDPTERALTIERVFDAPRALVFKLWTDPAHLARWWGPEGFTNLVWRIDVRPGGAWRREMAGPDGLRCVKCGEYREIRAPERLVFTYANEQPDGTLTDRTLVTVTFAAEGERTRVILHQARFDTVEARDAHRGGWTSALARFARYLAHH